MKPSDTTVLLELRPALDGLYGIPQETRLLFASLAARSGFRLHGLLQLSTHRVKCGGGQHENLPEVERVHRFARTVVSLNHFETRYFQDFVWCQLFGHSVPPAERELVPPAWCTPCMGWSAQKVHNLAPMRCARQGRNKAHLICQSKSCRNGIRFCAASRSSIDSRQNSFT